MTRQQLPAVSTERSGSGNSSSGAAAPTSTTPEPGTGDDAPTSSGQRLFSNLDPKTFAHQPGSVWGATLMVAGTTVGAGILALPAVTQVRRSVQSRLPYMGAGRRAACAPSPPPHMQTTRPHPLNLLPLA